MTHAVVFLFHVGWGVREMPGTPSRHTSLISRVHLRDIADITRLASKDVPRSSGAADQENTGFGENPRMHSGNQLPLIGQGRKRRQLLAAYSAESGPCADNGDRKRCERYLELSEWE
jgi:hypothetical protein